MSYIHDLCEAVYWVSGSVLTGEKKAIIDHLLAMQARLLKHDGLKILDACILGGPSSDAAPDDFKKSSLYLGSHMPSGNTAYYPVDSAADAKALEILLRQGYASGVVDAKFWLIQWDKKSKSWTGWTESTTGYDYDEYLTVKHLED